MALSLLLFLWDDVHPRTLDTGQCHAVLASSMAQQRQSVDLPPIYFLKYDIENSLLVGVNLGSPSLKLKKDGGQIGILKTTLWIPIKVR